MKATAFIRVTVFKNGYLVEISFGDGNDDWKVLNSKTYDSTLVAENVQQLIEEMPGVTCNLNDFFRTYGGDCLRKKFEEDGGITGYLSSLGVTTNNDNCKLTRKVILSDVNTYSADTDQHTEEQHTEYTEQLNQLL